MVFEREGCAEAYFEDRTQTLKQRTCGEPFLHYSVFCSLGVTNRYVQCYCFVLIVDRLHISVLQRCIIFARVLLFRSERDPIESQV